MYGVNSQKVIKSKHSLQGKKMPPKVGKGLPVNVDDMLQIKQDKKVQLDQLAKADKSLRQMVIGKKNIRPFEKSYRYKDIITDEKRNFGVDSDTIIATLLEEDESRVSKSDVLKHLIKVLIELSHDEDGKEAFDYLFSYIKVSLYSLFEKSNKYLDLRKFDLNLIRDFILITHQSNRLELAEEFFQRVKHINIYTNQRDSLISLEVGFLAGPLQGVSDGYHFNQFLWDNFKSEKHDLMTSKQYLVDFFRSFTQGETLALTEEKKCEIIEVLEKKGFSKKSYILAESDVNLISQSLKSEIYQDMFLYFLFINCGDEVINPYKIIREFDQKNLDFKWDCLEYKCPEIVDGTPIIKRVSEIKNQELNTGEDQKKTISYQFEYENGVMHDVMLEKDRSQQTSSDEDHSSNLQKMIRSDRQTSIDSSESKSDSKSMGQRQLEVTEGMNHQLTGTNNQNTRDMRVSDALNTESSHQNQKTEERQSSEMHGKDSADSVMNEDGFNYTQAHSNGKSSGIESGANIGIGNQMTGLFSFGVSSSSKDSEEDFRSGSNESRKSNVSTVSTNQSSSIGLSEHSNQMSNQHELVSNGKTSQRGQVVLTCDDLKQISENKQSSNTSAQLDSGSNLESRQSWNQVGRKNFERSHTVASAFKQSALDSLRQVDKNSVNSTEQKRFIQESKNQYLVKKGNIVYSGIEYDIVSKIQQVRRFFEFKLKALEDLDDSSFLVEGQDDLCSLFYERIRPQKTRRIFCDIFNVHYSTENITEFNISLDIESGHSKGSQQFEKLNAQFYELSKLFGRHNSSVENLAQFHDLKYQFITSVKNIEESRPLLQQMVSMIEQELPSNPKLERIKQGVMQLTAENTSSVLNKDAGEVFHSQNPQGLVCGSEQMSHQMTNRHVMVKGGTGAGKTSGVVIPTLYKANGQSFLVTDFGGTIANKTEEIMRKKGYQVKKINLMDPNQSDQFNPFYNASDPFYLKKNDIVLEKLRDCILTSASFDVEKDPFFVTGGKLVLELVMRDILDEKKKLEEKKKLKDKSPITPLEIFDKLNELSLEKLEQKKKALIAEGSKSKVLDIIGQIITEDTKNDTASLNDRFALIKTAVTSFRNKNLEEICNSKNIEKEVDIDDLQKKPTIIYLIVKQDELENFKMILSLFYTKFFSSTFQNNAEQLEGLRPVYCLMDECGQMAVPNFDSVLTTVRKYNVGIIGLLQSLSQFSDLYKSKATAIIENFTSKVFFPLDVSEGGLAKQLSEASGTKREQRGVDEQEEEKPVLSIQEIMNPKPHFVTFVTRGKCPIQFELKEPKKPLIENVKLIEDPYAKSDLEQKDEVKIEDSKSESLDLKTQEELRDLLITDLSTKKPPGESVLRIRKRKIDQYIKSKDKEGLQNYILDLLKEGDKYVLQIISNLFEDKSDLYKLPKYNALDDELKSIIIETIGEASNDIHEFISLIAVLTGNGFKFEEMLQISAIKVIIDHYLNESQEALAYRYFQCKSERDIDDIGEDFIHLIDEHLDGEKHFQCSLQSYSDANDINDYLKNLKMINGLIVTYINYKDSNEKTSGQAVFSELSDEQFERIKSGLGERGQKLKSKDQVFGIDSAVLAKANKQIFNSIEFSDLHRYLFWDASQIRYKTRQRSIEFMNTKRKKDEFLQFLFNGMKQCLEFKLQSQFDLYLNLNKQTAEELFLQEEVKQSEQGIFDGSEQQFRSQHLECLATYKAVEIDQDKYVKIQNILVEPENRLSGGDE